MTGDGFVALTKCYYCQKDHQILLNTRPHTFNKRVAEAHGKIVDMSPCTECEGFMKKGIILITIDHEKSEPDWFKERMPNPYRTGGWFVVTEDAVRRMFNGKRELNFALKERWIFIEHEAAKRVGLFDAAPTEGEGGKS
jgi:hypothetical protein